MKKSKSWIFALVLSIILVMYPTLVVRADSGWDGGYDGGGWDTGGWNTGSDWDTGSSWEHDWGSSSSGSNKEHTFNYSATNNDQPPLFYCILLMLMIIMCIVLTNKNSKKVSTSYSRISDSRTNMQNNFIDKIKTIMPDFNKEEFQNKTFEIYKNIQDAWMNFDYETLKLYTTDELFNLYRSQLEVLKIKNQKNIMKDYEILRCIPLTVEQSDKKIIIKAQYTIECYDYVIDQSGKTIRGNDQSKVTYEYEMTFIKGIQEKPNICPKCHAPLDDEVTSICPYCRAKVINDTHDWILSKKQVLSQSSNKKI